MITLPSSRKIGAGEKPFVIAELSSNWKNLEHLKESVNLAKGAGVDAIKYQFLNDQDLYGIPGEKTKDIQISLEWLSILKQRADSFGIEFMCSAFSPESYEHIDPYVNIHKIASSEMTHVRILEKIKSLGKPVILSTGASRKEEIEEALRLLGPIPVILMHCVSEYPTRAPNLSRITRLKTLFPQRLVGYSDHTLDVMEIPRKAIALGAVAIEKHFTNIDDETPDKGHSLTVDEIKNMVTAINDSNYEAPSSGERSMRLKHNRRLIATTDIPIGMVLEEGVNFGIFRSLTDDTRGLSPFLIGQVNGKLAARDLKKGKGIGPGDFK